MKIIGITGHPGSGKDTAADHLVKNGFQKISLGDVLREKMKKLGIPTDRTHMHEFVKAERAKYGNSYPADEVIEALDRDTVVVGFRNTEEVKRFTSELGADFFLIAVETPLILRYERAKQRNRHGDDVSLERFKEEELRERANDTGSHEVDRVMAVADATIVNDGTMKQFFEAIDRAIYGNGLAKER